MNLHALTQTLQVRRVRLFVVEGALRVRGTEQALTPTLRQEIQRHACTLLGRLTLYRHLRAGYRVRTPQGKGKVLQVFWDRVTVHLDDTERAEFFEPEEVEVL